MQIKDIKNGAVALTCGSFVFYIHHKTPSFEKPGVRGIIRLCD